MPSLRHQRPDDRQGPAATGLSMKPAVGLGFDIGRNPKVAQTALVVQPVGGGGRWLLAKARLRRVLLPETELGNLLTPSAGEFRLANRIELLLSDVGQTGDTMIRQRAEENEKIARARQQLVALDQFEARQEKIRERIKTFASLMNQARYEDAYRESLVMENELLNAGAGSPSR